MVVHPLKPVFDKNSKILILGSFPSVQSRKTMFYYGNKRNNFYKILAKLTNSEIPESNLEKENFLLANRIAVWDVVKECEIEKSYDSSIKNVIVNDIESLVRNSQIKAIFLNGLKAFSLFEKYFTKNKILTFKSSNNEILQYFYLPSTSPANSRFNLEKLLDEWGRIVDFLNK